MAAFALLIGSNIELTPNYHASNIEGRLREKEGKEKKRCPDVP